MLLAVRPQPSLQAPLSCLPHHVLVVLSYQGSVEVHEHLLAPTLPGKWSFALHFPLYLSFWELLSDNQRDTARYHEGGRPDEVHVEPGALEDHQSEPVVDQDRHGRHHRKHR